MTMGRAASGAPESPLHFAVGAVLQRFAGEEILYEPNTGNAGDSLIAEGTYRVFRDRGVRYRILGWEAIDATDRVLVYGGGGNLARDYRACRNFIERYHRDARHLVLLPHTIQGHDDLLSQLGPNVTLICRERVSFEHARRVARSAEVLLDHDMALAVDARATLRRTPRIRWTRRGGDDRVSPRSWILATARRVVSRRPTRHGELDAFRGDRERTRALPPGNIDVSELAAFGVAPETAAHLSSWTLLKVIDRYSRVRTNRLHVAVAAGLLGKPVELFPNSYYKNRAVYEHSLRDALPTITWLD
jgi:exopolysaccharide biosynthesis predicted pyruvyltransferase EpsI